MTRTVGIVGAACAVLAWWMAGTIASAWVWSIAVIVAGLGYGSALAAVTKQRVSLAFAAVVGLAVILVISTGLARAGFLQRTTQIGIVAAGLVAAIAVPARVDPLPPCRGSLLFAAFAAAIVIVVAAVQDRVLISDGANHVLAVKRLWDTGRLAVNHQAGAQLIGESYFALATGARAIAMFDQGACTALLVALIACEVAWREDGLGPTLLVMLALPAVLQPGPTREELELWAAPLLEVAMVLALQQALESRRTGWLVAPLALALACLRHEYAVVAIPFLVAALVLPVRERLGRRTTAIAGIAWSIGMLAMALSYRVGPGVAVLQLGAVWLALPLAGIGIWLLDVRWRSGLGVLAFAVASFALARACHAISPSFQAANASHLMWYGAGIAVVATSRIAIRPVVSGLVLALLVATTFFDTGLVDATRERLRDRFAEPALRMGELLELGQAFEADDDARAVQDRAPRAARIGFWGQSAGQLDFRRDRIVDLSWPPDVWRTDYFLSEITPQALRHVDYLIVETMFGRPERDPWGSVRPGAIDQIRDRLDPIASVGRATLYRVRQ